MIFSLGHTRLFRKILIGATYALLIGTIIGCSGCSKKSTDPDPVIVSGIIAINGVNFKGVMGSSTFDKDMRFAVADDSGNYLPNQQLQVSMVAGDGSGFPRSIATDSSGIALLTYTFSGVMGHATIRLTAGDDTLDIFLRANMLTPGETGQGQYILFTDTYADVLIWNGPPASIDIVPDAVDPNHRIIYVNYEQSLGVVVMLLDLDRDKTVYDTSSVYGVVVNTVYTGQTATTPPIGIGATLADMRTVLGEPAAVTPGEPDTVEIRYPYDGVTAYAYAPVGGDTTLAEIHLIEYLEPLPPVPFEIDTVNGTYFKLLSAPGNYDKLMQFAVNDSDGFRIAGADIFLEQIVGDGLLFPNNSIRTEANGLATMDYRFGGTLGHAVIRLTLPDVDTVDVVLRDNRLVPGINGHTQYVLFTDLYKDVIALNGQPASIDTIAADFAPTPTMLYANYESSLGLTFIFDDNDSDRQIYDTSSVIGTIVTAPYSQTTAGGIGIGSSLSALTTAYGATDSTVAGVGDEVRLYYSSLGAVFIGHTGDSLISKIRFSE